MAEKPNLIEKKENLKKGLIFALLATFFIGLQPVTPNLRPEELDPFIFAAVTGLIEALMFLPMKIIESKKFKNFSKKIHIQDKNYENKMNGWKRHKILLISFGLVFTIVPILLIIGYAIAGSINASLTLRSEIVYSLIFGFLILKERISKIQIVFSISLLFGLLLAITEGQFNLLSFNIGVLILLLAACLFVFEHTLIKSVFDKKELTPLQAVFIRNFFSGVVLISSYFLFFPIDNIRFLLDPKYYIFYILNALAYGLGLLFYYNTISNMQMGRAIILMSFSPIISAIFSIVLLNEVFSFYHLIGTSIVIFSIYVIIREKQ